MKCIIAGAVVAFLAVTASAEEAETTVLFEDDFEEGSLSESWKVLREGEYRVENGVLRIGVGEGNGNELNTCLELSDSDDWTSYRVTGRFKMDNTGENGPVIFHVHREGHQQQCVLLAGNEKPKIIEITSANFIRPEVEEEAKESWSDVFGTVGAIATAQNKFAYHMNVKDEAGHWSLLDTAGDKYAEGTWYDFELDVDEFSITFKLNGEQILHSSLLSRTGGTFAFGVADDTVLELDDIRIESL
ncbi:MAG: hypothetical protein JSW52_05265 [Candidatus Coatesbacteria bacterium]|nr:MAG: hypothetical protein JSW52_05265 [Candidatus Coatesbacteria bacterium]